MVPEGAGRVGEEGGQRDEQRGDAERDAHAPLVGGGWWESGELREPGGLAGCAEVGRGRGGVGGGAGRAEPVGGGVGFEFAGSDGTGDGFNGAGEVVCVVGHFGFGLVWLGVGFSLSIRLVLCYLRSPLFSSLSCRLGLGKAHRKSTLRRQDN